MRRQMRLLLGLLVTFSSPSLADERSVDSCCPLTAGVLVLQDGSRINIQCYGVRGEVVWLTTSDGKLQSVLRAHVNLEATERANGNRAPGGPPTISKGEATNTGFSADSSPSFHVETPATSQGGGDGSSSPSDDTATLSPEMPFEIDGPAAPEAPEVIARDEQGRVTVRAVRLDEPLDLDGKLEESVYLRTPSLGGFIQQEPREGEEATEKSEAWVFFDRDNVYVSARCWDSHPERMVVNEMRRDSRNLSQNETFAVILDTFYDRRNGFLFVTNPLGGLYDAQVTDERDLNEDWNTIWEVKTGRFGEGWTVEMALPFKSLRYKPGPSQIWSVNFRRSVRWKNEWSYLTPIAAAYGHQGLYKLSRAATLVGIEPPSRSMNLELKPYATAGIQTDLTAEEPYSNDLDSDVGFDVKYGVTRGLTSDFTYNTDFAQVEVDEQQVNLTRFGLFFPEKRDFFLEGQGLFTFAGRNTRQWGGGGDEDDMPILFFSRRIGLDEGLDEEDDEDIQVPINAGGRLTGRAGKYTLGALVMQTEAVPGEGVATTGFGVARLKRDILRRSNIGFISTYRSQALDTEGSNAVFGVDGNFSFFQNLDINTFYARSRTEGLQGQDASYMGRLYYGHDRYGVELQHLVVQDNFNPEIGFMRREDMRKSFGQLRFSPRPQSIEAIRKFTFQGNYNYIADNQGTVETRTGNFEFKIDFESSDSFEVQYTNTYEFLDEEFDVTDEVIIPEGAYHFQDFRYGYRLGPQRRVSGMVWFQHGSFYSGNRKEVSYWGRVELTKQLLLEPRISLNWVDLAEGSFTTDLISARINYMFTPRAFVAALIQYNSEDDSFSSNIRFRWEYRPGSDIYVVYSDERGTSVSDFRQLENRSLVFKITRLFRF